MVRLSNLLIHNDDTGIARAQSAYQSVGIIGQKYNFVQFILGNQWGISYCFIKWKEENNEEKCYGNRILCCGFSIYD